MFNNKELLMLFFCVKVLKLRNCTIFFAFPPFVSSGSSLWL